MMRVHDRGLIRVRRGALVLASLAVAMLALAASANGFVYWTNTQPVLPTLGHAALEGTGVDQDFITIPGGARSLSYTENAIRGLAVDSAYLYWAQDTHFVSSTSQTTYAIT